MGGRLFDRYWYWLWYPFFEVVLSSPCLVGDGEKWGGKIVLAVWLVVFSPFCAKEAERTREPPCRSAVAADDNDGAPETDATRYESKERFLFCCRWRQSEHCMPCIHMVMIGQVEECRDKRVRRKKREKDERIFEDKRSREKINIRNWYCSVPSPSSSCNPHGGRSRLAVQPCFVVTCVGDPWSIWKIWKILWKKLESLLLNTRNLGILKKNGYPLPKKIQKLTVDDLSHLETKGECSDWPSFSPCSTNSTMEYGEMDDMMGSGETIQLQ